MQHISDFFLNLFINQYSGFLFKTMPDAEGGGGDTLMYIQQTQDIYYVVITRHSNPLISKFSSPCNEFTSDWQCPHPIGIRKCKLTCQHAVAVEHPWTDINVHAGHCTTSHVAAMHWCHCYTGFRWGSPFETRHQAQQRQNYSHLNLHISRVVWCHLKNTTNIWYMYNRNINVYT